MRRDVFKSRLSRQHDWRICMWRGHSGTRTGMATDAGELGAKIEMARQLALWSEAPNGLTCTYYSPAHRAAAAQLRDWMRAAGRRQSK